MPKVSVLLPTYNTASEHLRECVDSILAQTFADFELLVLDDCSTETDVSEVMASYSDSRIRFLQNEKNLGISATRNKLLEMAQGEYLAVADHDDISLPRRFKLQVDFLDKHPEVGVVGGSMKKFPKEKILNFPLDNESIENMLMFQNALPHPASMLRKSTLEKNNIRYEEEFSPAEDHRMWTRLIGKTRFANLDAILLEYRSHKENTTHKDSLKISVKAGMATQAARNAHPLIWYRAQRNTLLATSYKLFGAVPFLSILENDNRKKYLLFNCIPLLTRKIKRLPL